MHALAICNSSYVADLRVPWKFRSVDLSTDCYVAKDLLELAKAVFIRLNQYTNTDCWSIPCRYHR